MNYIIRIIDVVIWPLIVGIAIYVFKDEVKKLLSRLRTADLSKKTFEFGEAPTDIDIKQTIEPKEEHSESVENESDKRLSQYPATIFWLANDLMWIQDMLYRNASAKTIYEGINSALIYLENLDLTNSMVFRELNQIQEYLELLPSDNLNFELTKNERNNFASKIEKVKWAIGSVIGEEEPNFIKNRVFPE